MRSAATPRIALPSVCIPCLSFTVLADLPPPRGRRAHAPEDSAEYLRMCMTRAGFEREVFASDAVMLLHEAAAGTMRDVDRLCAAALRETFRKRHKLVERDVVGRVIEADTRERGRCPSGHCWSGHTATMGIDDAATDHFVRRAP